MLISIIVPVYNVENYVSKCIESLLAQTHTILQIILIDDGSTDRSGSICDEYAEMDSRIMVVHQKHCGAAAARNKGLFVAQGEYIGFVDADDWCKPDMYKDLLHAIIDDKADAASCCFYLVNQQGCIEKKANLKKQVLTGREVINDSLQRAEHYAVIWDLLIKAEIVKNQDMLLFNPELVIGEDTDWLYRVLLRCSRVSEVPHAYYYYNKNNTSSITNDKETFYRYKMMAIDNCIGILKENGLDEKGIAIWREKKKKEQVKWMIENIESYISLKECEKKALDYHLAIVPGMKTSVISTLKRFLVITMIKLQMPQAWVGAIWRLHS